MAKIKLLTNGWYSGFPDGIFPVEVMAELREDNCYYVPEAELERIGCNMDYFDYFEAEEDPFWHFSESLGELEVINDEI